MVLEMKPQVNFAISSISPVFHKEIQGDGEGELSSLSEFTERVPSSVYFFWLAS